MENYNFSKYFNENMSSEEALHVYAKLLKSIPEEQRPIMEDALEKAYGIVADKILRRECEEVKKGWMF